MSAEYIALEPGPLRPHFFNKTLKPPAASPLPNHTISTQLLLLNPSHGVARRCVPHRPRRGPPPVALRGHRRPPRPATLRGPAPPPPFPVRQPPLHLPARGRTAPGGHDGVASDGGGDGAGPDDGAPVRQRPSLLRALPGYLNLPC